MAAFAGDPIRVIDSHTGGEPTRVIVAGGPELGSGSLAERRARFRDEFDDVRTAVLNEPRGSAAIVGALLCPPTDRRCVTGVIFFNDAGYLGMCGHGAIGVAVTLAHLGRIGPGRCYLETPVGVVAADYLGQGAVGIENVPGYRFRADVEVNVPEFGWVRGDIAWGGNWFFLSNDHRYPLDLEHVDELTRYADAIRESLRRQGITGSAGADIDHIELIGAAHEPTANARNFVLCPGRAYDRSPCGTGTSAKLACLAADRQIAEGAIWRQESVLGTVFEGSMRLTTNGVLPTIKGWAYVCAESTLLFQPDDPFRLGIR